MTPKQKLFCEHYIVSLNATESARKAGYSKRTAHDIGCENLTKPNIRAYIDQRMNSKTNDIVASQDEILRYLTKIIRKEEVIIINYIDKNGELQSYNKYPDFTAILRAIELLGKRYGMWDKDEKPKETMDINIICDIPRPADLMDNDTKSQII